MSSFCEAVQIDFPPGSSIYSTCGLCKMRIGQHRWNRESTEKIFREEFGMYMTPERYSILKSEIRLAETSGRFSHIPG